MTIENKVLARQLAIAERIRSLLALKGMTQRELARKAGMKDSAISRILQGQTNLTLRTITLLEDGLGERLIAVDNHD